MSAFCSGQSLPRRQSSCRQVSGAILLLGGALLLAACDLGGSGGGFARQESTKLGPRIVQPGQPVPKGGGRYKIGSPYRLNGQTYVPREVRHYDAKGTASWYGDLFHGRRTANGEIYDMEALTAAHPTLPLPSYARVTNLSNGRALIVRVNDRGPYARGREIDLSWAVASLLQMRVNGTAPVRVEYVGPAPLNGDDSYERQVLAHQRWAGPGVAFAASPAKAMRHAGASRSDRYTGAYLRTGDRPAPAARPAMRMATSNAARPEGPPARDWPGASAALPRRDEIPRERRDLASHAAITGANHPAAPPPVSTLTQNTAAFEARPRMPRRAYVDAGLFPDRQTAERLASALTELAPVSLEPENLGGSTFHRLRIGPFAGNQAAEAAVTRIRAAGLTGAYVQPAPGG